MWGIEFSVNQSGRLLDDSAINQAAGVGLLLEVESAPAEEEIDADPDVGGKELRVARRFVPSGRQRSLRLPRSMSWPDDFQSRSKAA